MKQSSLETSVEQLTGLYRTMVTAREMDLLEQSFTGRGEAFFHVSGAGHEATAVLNEFLIEEDWLHCHYRDKALMLARGISPRMFFYSLFNKDLSHSRGRQMNAHMSAPELRVLSLVGPVGNSALQAAGVAEVAKGDPKRPIVLCSLGDGMTQEGEVYEALGQAVRDTLPILFLIQDNAFAISTKTRGKTFYSHPDGEAESFYGIPIIRVDGRDPLSARESLREVTGGIRENRKPQIVIFEVDRLHNHTNADDQRMYRTPEEIEAVQESGDPLIALQKVLLDGGVSPEEIEEIHEKTREELRREAKEAQRSGEPRPFADAKRPLPQRLTSAKFEYRGTDGGADGNRLTMLEAIREVLDLRMGKDDRVTLYGEDLEDPKGDVFGVTKGLSTKYPGRVRNSPLSESLILGVSIGEALAGRRPVAFLQFADFLPIAYNQIVSELGSMYWRTDGAWEVPVIVMISCGGYKPGLGPFHASSFDGLAAHTPGVDVMMPSTAGDAAGMLNAAFESGRPTLFFYPKNLLNNKESATSPDVERQLVPIGAGRVVRSGDAITLVGWGNTVTHCRKTAATLEEHGVEAEVLDLRTLSPWDKELVIASAEKTGRLVVVHEDNHSAGMGAEVAATVAEGASRKVAIRRVTRPDTFVPCNFANQLEILPSYKRTLETAVDLLGGSLRWKAPEAAQRGYHFVEAIGSSPSDESITVVDWHVSPGTQIASGDMIAELEADKAAVDLKSPVDGVVEEILVEQGDTVPVGAPVLKVKIEEVEGEEYLKPQTREEPGEPIIEGLDILRRSAHAPQTGGSSGTVEVAISGIAGVKGSRTVTNEEISELCPTWSPEDIVKRTGIETRPWVTEGEDALSLAVEATRRLLENQGVTPQEIGLWICSTGTPTQITPSMAALIQYSLATREDPDYEAPAYDINAACSGYLYGLQIAYDFLQQEPGRPVLLVTTEALSPKLDTADPATAPIFGDAATATLIHGGDKAAGALAKVYRPVISAKGEDGSTLSVPALRDAHIAMDGPKVYLEAVRSMIAMLEQACAVAGTDVDGLDLIVPHQANQRIINAIRQRAKQPRGKLYSNIAYNGNTSSCTIPLALEEVLARRNSGEKLGMAAFGGGYTYAGGVIEKL
ncbi:MAG: thiamine pyrophosphate-dependent enzyme [Alkalispirochaetaceae bacterium]